MADVVVNPRLEGASLQYLTLSSHGIILSARLSLCLFLKKSVISHCMCAESLQLCLTLCNPMDPLGSSFHWILQARILEWVAMPSSRGSSWPRGKMPISEVSCIGRWVLITSCHTWSPCCIRNHPNNSILMMSSKILIPKKVVPDSLRPRWLYAPWHSPGQNTGGGSLSLLQRDLPNPGIEPKSPTLQEDSLPAEPQEKFKNTGEGSLSVL